MFRIAYCVTQYAPRSEGKTVKLRGKRVIAIGEREGVQGPSLKALAESAGAQVVFSVTQCFV